MLQMSSHMIENLRLTFATFQRQINQGRDVTFRRRQHEISKVDRTVFSDVGVASENGK
ncbi:putative integrase domain protein (plasmid) [Burkholderia gladioli]|nr:putative integrase domain protein [Burkholderia gladioli]